MTAAPAPSRCEHAPAPRRRSPLGGRGHRRGAPLRTLSGLGVLGQSGKLGTVLRSLGFTPTEADVEEMQGKAGPTVNFDGLLGFISAAKAKTIKEPDVVEALKVFDKDGNGFIKTVRGRGRPPALPPPPPAHLTGGAPPPARPPDRCRPWPQDEVKRILSQLGEKLSAREVEAILAEADPRRSGQVPYDFFVGMVKAF